jgi:hypothetical protein
LAISDHWIVASEDDRLNFVIEVAAGAMRELDEIAGQLRTWRKREA